MRKFEIKSLTYSSDITTYDSSELLFLSDDEPPLLSLFNLEKNLPQIVFPIVFS